MFDRKLIILRGGGDLATGAAYRLHRVGFPVVVLELAWPLVVRRKVSLADAVHEGEIDIEGLVGRLVHDFANASALALTGVIPVLVSPRLPDLYAGEGIQKGQFESSSAETIAIVDARLAKRNIDTRMDQAPTVIALGPGFTAGFDCHAVIETMRGHHLGRVIWDGQAQQNTGIPGRIGGKGADRVLRAPVDGEIEWVHDIGDLVEGGSVIGSIKNRPITAPFDGVIRGLIAPGTEVTADQKIGDVDSRSDVSACFTISDKALAVGGGVLEALLTRLNTPAWMTE